MKRLTTILAVFSALIFSGCEKSPTETAPGHGKSGDQTQAAAPTNRVDIPAPVRKNLGITFAKVERRSVGRTLRVPGRFELIPTARREYLAMADGRVEVLVSQYEKIEAGTPLYRLESSRWRELQEQLSTAQAGVQQSRARSESMGPLLAAHADHQKSLREKVALWTERLTHLETIRQAGGGQQSAFTEARGVLKDTEADLADVVEQEAELAARKREGEAELQAAIARLELLLDTAAVFTGISTTELEKPGGENVTRPLWHTLNAVEVKSAAPGVVASIGASSGALVKEGTLVVSTIQPELLRFHARALQADLGRLRDGLASRIVAPKGAATETQADLPASLTVGLEASADDRTIELLATPTEHGGWARAGVTGYLEVTLEGGSEELAVPLSCIVRDGAKPILFRRDPSNPDKAIRMDADVGIDDGFWVVISSGVKAGDEIVLDGVYQLMLATAGNAPKGGHFHSDGTFHEGGDH